jgi:hypothetical protein
MMIKLNFVRRLKFNIETHEFTNALLKVYKDRKNSELAPYMNIPSNVTILSRRATELYEEMKINIKNRIKI